MKKIKIRFTKPDSTNFITVLTNRTICDYTEPITIEGGVKIYTHGIPTTYNVETKNYFVTIKTEEDNPNTLLVIIAKNDDIKKIKEEIEEDDFEIDEDGAE